MKKKDRKQRNAEAKDPLAPREERSEAGAIAIVVALLMVAMVGFSALVIDVGSLYEQRRQLQTAADAAALAGVQELPSNPDAARAIATAYAKQNSADDNAVSVTISQTYVPNDTIRVTVSNPDSPTYFARIWGRSSAAVSARAIAFVGSPAVMPGRTVMPMAILAKGETTLAGAPYGFVYGEDVIIKRGAGTGYDGNFQFATLSTASGDNGAPYIRDALKNGGVYNEVIKGAIYETQTGINGSWPTNELIGWINRDFNHQYSSQSHTFALHGFGEICTDVDSDGLIELDNPAGETHMCHRVIVCPIIAVVKDGKISYNPDDLVGQSNKVKVLDFAYFFISEVWDQGNDSFVKGRFIKIVEHDALQVSGYTPGGSVVYKLVE
jgi:Flp pilus assembly protein TadG